MDDQKKAAELATARKIEALAERILQQQQETYARDKIIGTITGTLGDMEAKMRAAQDVSAAARRRIEELGG